MMRPCGSDEANKLFEHLKSVLEIPENVFSLDLHMAVNDVVVVTCTYAPNFKNVPKLCHPVEPDEYGKEIPLCVYKGYSIKVDTLTGCFSFKVSERQWLRLCDLKEHIDSLR